MFKMVFSQIFTYYVLIKDIGNQASHRDIKRFCWYCFQSFSTPQILERHVNDCFEINDKQMIKMTKKRGIVKFKNYTTKIKPSLIIYTDFESIFISENNWKQNPDEPYNNKYQNRVSCSYRNKLVCAENQFSKHFKSY